jgi:hypothetical protein
MFCENFYYVLALQRAAVVAAAVGEADDAVAFAAQSVLLSESVVSQFFDQAKGVWDNGGANAQVEFKALKRGSTCALLKTFVENARVLCRRWH